ncbi:hypothetical protein JWG45_20805 [Leptospira sp. 201903070]|uniref:Uncharacterized protein n=1 Tax=Leptospira ainlahdjerensis TaxID=2810033 RepID=A0ABS2UJZ8_9LEPT|nr:hypothetical protein [Leptospira ainlahdjerensis]MBM9579590.1 hypothetical protein [Leptospira ainlahdjerensis]
MIRKKIIIVLALFCIIIVNSIVSEKLPHERFELSPVFNPLLTTMNFLNAIRESNIDENSYLLDKPKILKDLRSRHTYLNQIEFEDRFNLCLLGGKIFKVPYPVKIRDTLDVTISYEGHNAKVTINIHNRPFDFLLSRIDGKEPWKITGGTYFDLICKED